MSKVEIINNRNVRRTGWTTSARQCPRHGCDLELCFDETDFSTWSAEHQVPFNHDDDRIRWRCEPCLGSWLENWFLGDARAIEATRRLVLKCPDCGSLRVTHECVPECCEQHVCIDCGRGFEADATIISINEQAVPPVAEDKSPLAWVGGSRTPPPIRSHWHRSFRRCDRHGSELELVFIGILDDAPPTALAWYCETCAASRTEPSFRNYRRLFVLDVRAGIRCPSCRSPYDIESEGDPLANEAHCRACDARFRIVLRPGERRA